jgi:hypothetical protein
MQRKNLIILSITFLLIFISALPILNVALYPLRLFVTFIHEGCHALAALLTGGHVISISIYPSMGGITWTQGGYQPLITSAGYLGTMLIGIVSIIALQHEAPPKAVLLALVGILGINIVYTGLGSLFGTFWGGLLILSLLVAAFDKPVAAFLAPLLGVQLMLGAFYDMKTLLILSTMNASTQTDASVMARITGIPSLIWVLLWMSLSAFSVWMLFKPSKNKKLVYKEA